MKTLASLIAGLVLTAAPGAFALSATQTVLKEIRTEDAAGNVSVDYVDASLVTPGETVIYRLDYVNDADEPVTDMVLTMPVPVEVAFRDGSADRAGTQTLYSADGGNSFSTRDALIVRRDDGSELRAEAADITHVRWIFSEPLAPGSSGDIAFAGLLK